MAYSLPDDVHQRPVTIDGAGTLGRRIATVFAAGGSDVRIFDTSAEQREAGRDHVEQHVAEVQQTLDLRPDRTGARRGRRRPVARGRRRVAGHRVGPRARRREDRRLRRAGPARRARRHPRHQLLVAAQPPGHRQGRAPRARPQHALPAAAGAQRRRAHVLRQDGPRDHRRAHGQAARLWPRAVPRPARERRVHLQPDLGGHQARMPDGRRGGRRRPRGHRRDVEDLHASRHPALPAHGPRRPRRRARHRGALRGRCETDSPRARARSCAGTSTRAVSGRRAAAASTTRRAERRARPSSAVEQVRPRQARRRRALLGQQQPPRLEQVRAHRAGGARRIARAQRLEDHDVLGEDRLRGRGCARPSTRRGSGRGRAAGRRSSSAAGCPSRAG